MDAQPTLRSTAVLALLLGVATTATAETRPRYGRTLTASLLGSPAVFDPHKARSHAELTVADLVFDGLYRPRGGEVEPELASALPVLSEDRLELTIAIRVGAYFHDGKTLTTDDVVASLERLRKGPAGWMLASVDSIEANKDSAVVIRLRYPDADLPARLASPIAAITSKGKTPVRRRLVGTGPFKLRSVNRSKRELRFDAFDNHHRGRAYLDQLRLRWHEKHDDEARAYEVGELHMSFRGDVAFSGHKPKYVTNDKEGKAAILSYVGFGRANAKVLANQEFRRAVSLALNRKGLRRMGTGESVAPSVRPDSRAAGAPRLRSSEASAQLKKAKDTLAVAAQSVSSLSDPSSLNLNILVNRSRLDDIDIADKVLASLDKLGISATVVEVSADVFNKRVARGACDLYIGQLLAPSPIQSAQIAAAFAAGGDSWATKALERAPLDLTSAASEFRRRLPIIPLFHRSVRAHHRSDVFGLEFNESAQLQWADLFMFGSPKLN